MKLLFAGRSCATSKNLLLNFLFKRDSEIFNSYHLSKSIHLTKVNKEISDGLYAVGAGVAVTGAGNAAKGVGLTFGNGLLAMSRNPSLKTVAQFMILGTAFSEALGLICAVIAFLLITKL